MSAIYTCGTTFTIAVCDTIFAIYTIATISEIGTNFLMNELYYFDFAQKYLILLVNNMVFKLRIGC